MRHLSTPSLAGRVAALVASLVLSACTQEDLIAPKRAPAGASAGVLDGVASPPPIGAALPPTRTVTRLAYVLAYDSTAATYVPTHDSYNSAGAVNEIQHIGIGHYAVLFGGLSSLVTGGGKETVIATGYGVALSVCNADFWFNSQLDGKVHVRVDCFNRITGAPADSKFTLLMVGNGALPDRHAFAIASQPTALSYTPDPAYSFTTGTSPMLVTKNAGAGDWLVQLGTANPVGSTYLASPQDGQSQCAIAEWKSLGARVRCFDQAGASADVPFKALQLSRGRPGARFGFAWANLPTTASYTPNPNYSYNSSGGAIMAEHVGLGQYVVAFAGLTSGGTPRPLNVQVTPFGVAYASCHVSTWYDDANWLIVWTFCFDKQGNQLDTRFNVVVME